MAGLGLSVAARDAVREGTVVEPLHRTCRGSVAFTGLICLAQTEAAQGHGAAYPSCSMELPIGAHVGTWLAG